MSSHCWYCEDKQISQALQYIDPYFIVLQRIQEKETKLKMVEESLQAAQDSSSAREKTVEVQPFPCISINSLADFKRPFLHIVLQCCPCLGSCLNQFLSHRLWSSSWLPCRQRWSSWDRRRQQKRWPALLLSSKNSRLSELNQHLSVSSLRTRLSNPTFDDQHLTNRLVGKDQKIQTLQSELEARTKELSEKIQQVQQQCSCYTFSG